MGSWRSLSKKKQNWFIFETDNKKTQSIFIVWSWRSPVLIKAQAFDDVLLHLVVIKKVRTLITKKLHGFEMTFGLYLHVVRTLSQMDKNLWAHQRIKIENISWHHRQLEDIITDIHSMLNLSMAQFYSRFVINSRFFCFELELANKFYFPFPFCFA